MVAQAGVNVSPTLQDYLRVLAPVELIEPDVWRTRCKWCGRPMAIDNRALDDGRARTIPALRCEGGRGCTKEAHFLVRTESHSSEAPANPAGAVPPLRLVPADESPSHPPPPTSSPPSSIANDQLADLFPDVSDDADAPWAVMQLNNEFAVVVEGGRAMIWRAGREQGRIVYDRFTERDFRLLKLNQTVEVPTDWVEEEGEVIATKTKEVSLAPFWLKHPKRRTYEKVIFDPTPGLITPNGTLNLWRGLTVRPAPGRWDRFDAHLREVICGGDEHRYRYLRHWLARTIQRPDQRGEVAVVLRGMKGAGKGTLGNALVKLHGQHGLHISSPRYLVGNFNSPCRIENAL